MAASPLFTRADLVRAQLEQLSDNRRRPSAPTLAIRAGTTGRGAELLVLTWSAADLGRERVAGARLLGRLGIAADMRVANTLPGGLATPGSLLLGDVVEVIGALDIPLGSVASAAAARTAWELFDRVRPDVLILDTVSAGPLFTAPPPIPRPWWRAIIWLHTSNVPPERAVLPAAAGFRGWQRAWLAIPEVTSFVAASCSEGRFHTDDEVILEIVEATGASSLPVNPIGEVVVALGAQAATCRYRSGLRGRLVSTCVCGEPGQVLELAPGTDHSDVGRSH